MKLPFLLLLASFTSLFLPNVSPGQTPNLGAASSFTVFTAVGAVTNTGTTLINGDAGTNVGAFTGSPTVTGQTHVADAISASASTDVDAAYSYIYTLTCDSILGTTLGNNQILAPNNYCMGAAASLNGILILDGQNDSTSVFIFQINGAFSTSTLSKVILVNKASSCNVYWQVNGLINIGDSSIFRGTAIANGAINLFTGATFEGRVFTRAGAISMDNNLVNECTQSLVSLPVMLISFNAEKDVTKTKVNLSWETASESNTAHFLVERSLNGLNFKTIGKQQAGGNSYQLLSYFYTDEIPAHETNYYRLNQVDLNGEHRYSSVKTVNMSGIISAVNIYPNPFTSSIEITINDASPVDNYQLRLYDFSGTEVTNIIISKPISTIETIHLSSGIYLYKITGSNEFMKSGVLVAQ